MLLPFELSDGLPMLKQGDTVTLEFQDDAYRHQPGDYD